MFFPFKESPVKAGETDHLLDTAASCTLLGSLAHALSPPSSLLHHTLLCVFGGELSYSCFLDQSTTHQAIIKILRFIIGIFFLSVCIGGSYERVYESQMTTAGIMSKTSFAWAGLHGTFGLSTLTSVDLLERNIQTIGLPCPL